VTEPVVKVVVVDDHPVFLIGMAALLRSMSGITVVGEATTLAEAVDIAIAEVPDVVIMDLDLGGDSGVEATREIVRACPDVGVLVVTMLGDDDSLFASIRAGARGYLLKGADRDEIVRAVLAVAGGDAVYGGSVARRVVDALTGTAVGPTSFPELTGREREVLDLLAAGLPTSRIAHRLALSDKTVRNHVSAVLTKLQVPDRAAAVARARDAGLGGGRGAGS
jgi:DNA-binding NarL/FixJ family response regulator